MDLEANDEQLDFPIMWNFQDRGIAVSDLVKLLIINEWMIIFN